MLLQNFAKLTSGDESEEEKAWKVCLYTVSSSMMWLFICLSQALSIKLQESKSFKSISAVSVSPNREYIAIGTAGKSKFTTL